MIHYEISFSMLNETCMSYRDGGVLHYTEWYQWQNGP